jgi:hypothetical protein
MVRDNALGNDPLGWIKLTKEGKKVPTPEHLSAEKQKEEKVKQQTTVNQQKLFPTKSAEAKIVSDTTKTKTETKGPVNNVTAKSKPKVVIGKMYEKPSVEGLKQIETEVSISKESKNYNTQPPPSYITTQPFKINNQRVEHIPASTSAISFSTYIVIAYTALIVILGFFVYHDLSKRINRLESKILTVEKSLSIKK